MEPVLRSQRRQVRRGCRAAAWWGRRSAWAAAAT